jgi:hypothetical protein
MPVSTDVKPDLPEGTLAEDLLPRLTAYFRNVLAADEVAVTYRSFIDSTATDGPGPLPVERSQFAIKIMVGDRKVLRVINGLAIARAVNLSRMLSVLATTLAEDMGVQLLKRKDAPTWSELQADFPPQV